MTPQPFEEEEDSHEEEHDHEEESKLEISLTRNEALFLDDSLTLMIERDHDDHRVVSMRPVQNTAGLAVPLDLMDKVGKAVVYTTTPEHQGQEYKVGLDMSEVFMLREISQSFIKIGDEPVGYNLKRKLCSLLYAEELAQEDRDSQVSKLLKDVDLETVIEEADVSADSKKSI
tara:strand:+ start:1117 stop:1635 length:519 start_codon:yes stop_codon:yes gene_type:complete